MKADQGIAEMTLATLKRIEKILENGVGFEPVLPPIVSSGETDITYERLLPAISIEEDRGRNGYFSAVFSRDDLIAVLRWTPGTEAIFPTFDQMAEARSGYMKAVEWDFSALGGDSHLFGIPLRFA